jgi:hypothetical protein
MDIVFYNEGDKLSARKEADEDEIGCASALLEH